MTTRPLSRPDTMPVLSLRTVLRSETIKLRSLRAIVWLIGIAGAFVALLGPFQALGQIVAAEPRDRVADLDAALSLALTGFGTSSILFGIAGTLVVTSEYPRSIRTTFTVVPRRSHVVHSKLLATARAVLFVGLTSAAVAVVVSSVLLDRAGVDLSLTDRQTLRTVVGAAWYALAWAAFGQALGWLLRSTVGAVTSLLGLMFVLPALVTLLPSGVVDVIYPVLPSQAAGAMVASTGHELALSPGGGFLVVTAYFVIGFPLLARLVSARDA